MTLNGMTTEQLLKCRLWNKKGALFPVHLFFREGNFTLDVDTSILYGMFQRTSFDWAGGTSKWDENISGGAFLFSITNFLSKFEQNRLFPALTHQSLTKYQMWIGSIWLFTFRFKLQFEKGKWPGCLFSFEFQLYKNP